MMKKRITVFFCALIMALMSFTFTKQPAKDKAHPTSDFIITHGQAGPFTLNSAISSESQYKGYDIVKKEQIRYAEDGADTLTVYHAQKEGITHIIIHPKRDNKHLVGELEVISSLYKTKAGIGVGSSLNDFYTYYPKAKAYYTFISGMYWVEQPIMQSAQFLIDESAYSAEPDDFSDLTVLDKSKLDMKSRIVKIRIY